MHKQAYVYRKVYRVLKSRRQAINSKHNWQTENQYKTRKKTSQEIKYSNTDKISSKRQAVYI